MKISLSDIEGIVAPGCENPSRPRRDDCPPPEKLVLCARSALSKKGKNAITGHLMICRDCAAEVKTILAVFAEESRLIRDLQDSEPAPKKAKPKAMGLPGWRPAWRIASAVSAVVVLAALGMFLLSRFAPRSDRQRGTVLAFNLVSPVNKAFSVGELKFTWKGPAAKYNVVEVFDSSLSLLWRSAGVVGNEVAAPEELTRKLKPEETYFWMVTAVSEDGARVKSKLGEFKTKDKTPAVRPSK